MKATHANRKVSCDLLIPPGETIADVLQDRNMTRAELADKTGVSLAYVNGVIEGEEDISEEFAYGLERVFHVSKSFWMNLQSHYDAEREETQRHTVPVKFPLLFVEIMKHLVSSVVNPAKRQKV